jgi:hypothetical protein
MGDPFSVGGGAVGFIALGLSVCKGLLSYAKECKGSDAEVETLTRETENLRATLKTLDITMDEAKKLEALPFSEQTKSAQIAVEASKKAVEDLGSALDHAKPRPRPSSSAGSSVKATWNRASYPLKQRPGIMDLLQKVKRVQAHLQTALDSLNMLVISVGLAPDKADRTVQCN